MDSTIEKAEAIVKKLTLKQKVHLLYGDGDWHTFGLKKTSITPLEMHDGPLGLRNPDGSAAANVGRIGWRIGSGHLLPRSLLNRLLLGS
jgi:hypothetical protein